MAIGRYVWYCPYENCDGKSTKILSFGKAKRYGKAHLRRIHNDKESLPVIEKFGKN